MWWPHSWKLVILCVFFGTLHWTWTVLRHRFWLLSLAHIERSILGFALHQMQESGPSGFCRNLLVLTSPLRLGKPENNIILDKHLPMPSNTVFVLFSWFTHLAVPLLFDATSRVLSGAMQSLKTFTFLALHTYAHWHTVYILYTGGG